MRRGGQKRTAEWCNDEQSGLQSSEEAAAAAAAAADELARSESPRQRLLRGSSNSAVYLPDVVPAGTFTPFHGPLMGFQKLLLLSELDTGEEKGCLTLPRRK